MTAAAAAPAFVMDRKMVDEKSVGIVCLKVENRDRFPNRLHGNNPLSGQGLPIPGNDPVSGTERLQGLESAVSDVKRMIRRHAKRLLICLQNDEFIDRPAKNRLHPCLDQLTLRRKGQKFFSCLDRADGKLRSIRFQDHAFGQKTSLVVNDKSGGNKRSRRTDHQVIGRSCRRLSMDGSDLRFKNCPIPCQVNRITGLEKTRDAEFSRGNHEGMLRGHPQRFTAGQNLQDHLRLNNRNPLDFHCLQASGCNAHDAIARLKPFDGG